MEDGSNDAITDTLKKNKMAFTKKLGSRIEKIRRYHNLNQSEYATILCIEKKVLLKIESGKKNPDSKVLFILESYFGADGDWLLTGKGEMIKDGYWSAGIENSVQFLKMFNRLQEEGKKKMLNVLKVFLKTEHMDRENARPKQEKNH